MGGYCFLQHPGGKRVQRDLVIKAQHGDSEAFGALASGALGRLHGIAYRILRDGDQADDATQQALMSAWDHLSELRDPDRFDAWTYRLVVRAAYKEAKRTQAARDRIRWVPSPAREGPRMDEAIADRDEVEQAFKTLSPQHRAVLTLRYYADLPLAEIASILDIPLGTVASRLHHATQKLRDELRPQGRSVRVPGQVVS
jgi:RNA polymerase sigma-70 factor (ECF subfamily)